MANKILLLEKNDTYATGLNTVLSGMLGYEVTRVNTELALVRELSSGHFELIIVGIREARKKEGLRLIQILLVEKKVAVGAPIVVLSDTQDTGFIQSCVQAGIADYILYPNDPVEIAPRLKKALDNAGGVGDALVRVSTTFLGPASKVFIEKQAQQRLGLASLQHLTRDHLPDFIKYLAVAIKPILKEKVVQFVRRLEQVFGIHRQS